MFDPDSFWDVELIRIERKPLKRLVGLDEERRFFSPTEIMACSPLHDLADDFRVRRSMVDASLRPSPDERAALEAERAFGIFASFVNKTPMPLYPMGEGETFDRIALSDSGNPASDAETALHELGAAWRHGADCTSESQAFAASIEQLPTYTAPMQRRVSLEKFYNTHRPWMWAAVASGLALLAFGAKWLTNLRVLSVLIAVFIAWAVAEQVVGLGLRIAILGRPPVSNTYEALLWMGLVSIIIGGVAQLINRRSWYLAGAMAACLISILFAMLVPLQDQTNSLPAVLRSNYWLIIHVLTITASYGALLLAAVIGHAYLIRNVLLARPDHEPSSRLVVQVYRVMQLGLILLTAGTILGGVWAADSWGRFWGWDPKETWSLISIIVYFALIHARYVGWLRDFGLAVASIIGFMAIVWTFYGVNYVLASGLHSYGFGTGGEFWVAMWAIAEVVFIGVCLLRRAPTKPTGPDNNTRSRDQSTRAIPASSS